MHITLVDVQKVDVGHLIYPTIMTEEPQRAEGATGNTPPTSSC